MTENQEADLQILFWKVKESVKNQTEATNAYLKSIEEASGTIKKIVKNKGNGRNKKKSN